MMQGRRDRVNGADEGAQISRHPCRRAASRAASTCHQAGVGGPVTRAAALVRVKAQSAQASGRTRIAADKAYIPPTETAATCDDAALRTRFPKVSTSGDTARAEGPEAGGLPASTASATRSASARSWPERMSPEPDLVGGLYCRSGHSSSGTTVAWV